MRPHFRCLRIAGYVMEYSYKFWYKEERTSNLLFLYILLSLHLGLLSSEILLLFYF